MNAKTTKYFLLYRCIVLVDRGGVENGRVELGGVDRGGVELGGVDRGGALMGGVDRGGVELGGVDRGGVLMFLHMFVYKWCFIRL